MHSNSSDVNPGVDFADFFFFAFLSPAGGSFVSTANTAVIE